MNENANFYYDKNAFIERKVPKKQKVDLNHIEKVVYPVNYGEFPEHYDKNMFVNPHPPRPKSSFDISKILPLLLNGGDISSLMPTLLSNLGMGKELLPLLNSIPKTKKVEATVVEKDKENDEDSISKYERVED